MIKLQIRRKTNKVWQHFITDGENFIFSKCYCKTNGDKFRVVEDGGTAKNEYNYDEIEVYDDLNSGSAETFTSSLELMERLSVLSYVGFSKDGDVVIADLISTDPSNAIEEGTDGKLFVEISGKLDKNTTPLSVYATDALGNQEMKLISELGINIYDLQKYSLYAWRPTPTGWYGFTTPATVGTADNQSPLFSGNDFIRAFRRRYASASTAGSSVEFYETSFRQTSVGDGFFFSMKFGNEDVASVADARLFSGLTGLGAIGNVNPSTLASMIGVGADSGDANLQFMHNDSAGTAVKVDLGASFPANSIATDLYCLQMYNVRGQSSIWWRVLNVTSNAVTAWAQVTSELPATSFALIPHCWRNNGTTALAVRLSLVDLTLYKNI